MNNKLIRFSLTENGIDYAIQEVEKYRKWLEGCSKKLLNRLANEGLFVATMRFEQAVYDGENDVTVWVAERGKAVRAITALGNATLFIEFGTGIHYASPAHPEADRHGMIRGEYGQGLGKNDWWIYKGEPGNAGGEHFAKRPGLTITHGNPANMSMYETVKTLERKSPEIVREVFQ